MSEGNVELHRRSVSAFNSRDADAYVALAHELLADNEEHVAACCRIDAPAKR